MRSALIFSLALFCAISAQAQTRFVRNFSVADGLSQSEVSDIIEDGEGRILLNTGASGIDRFDGVEFSVLTEKDGLCSSIVQKLYRDLNGEIWAVSNSGMSRYASGVFEPFPFDTTDHDVSVIFDTWGSLEKGFIHGTNNGLLLVNGSTTEHLHQDLRLKVFGLLAEGDGRILCASDKGLFSYERKQLKQLIEFSSFGDGTVYSIAEHHSGAVLLGLKGAIAWFRGDSATVVPLEGMEEHAIITIEALSEKRTLLGTNGNGLLIEEESGTLTHLTESNGLHDNYIWSVYEDEQDNIWLGTSGGGVDVLGHDLLISYSPSDGLNGDIIYDIHQDPQGRMWFGAVEGGMTIFDGNERRYLGVENGLSHRTVRCTFQDNDTLWIGTENGVCIEYNNKITDMSTLIGVKDFSIFDIHRNTDGKLWFACKGERYYGSNGGVVVWDGKDAVNYTIEDGLADNNVYCIYEVNKELWLGTSSGISIWDGKQFRLLPNAPGSCNSTVLCLRTDNWGTTWIGTLGGVAYYRDGETRCIQQNTELQADYTFLLELHADSQLFIGSSKGLEILNLNTFHNEGRLSTTLYNDNNGFLGTECNQNAVCKDDQGRFWFGTIKGAVRLDPSKLKNANGRLKAYMRGLRTQQLIDSPPSTRTKDGKLEFAYNQNNLIIDFFSNEVIDPSSIMYSFRTEGVLDTWSDWNKQRSIFYTNLAPGSYSIQLRAKNLKTGQVAEAETLQFNIVPAFWQTTWFKVLASVLLILLGMGLAYKRIEAVREKERQEAIYQRSIYELEMKALRAQINPHFIFNTLNSLKNFIIQNKPAEASDHLSKFAKLIRLVLQNSEEKLVPLQVELDALDLYMRLEQIRFSESFKTNTTIADNVNLLSEKIPPLLLQPYVENAIWHGIQHLKNRKGQIDITINRQQDGLRICIADNGVGRALATKMRSKSTLKKKSMGMQLNAERIKLSEELYKGRSIVQIHDRVDEDGQASGTTVELILNYS